MEIERKFLVAKLPDGWGQYTGSNIEQCYLCVSPAVRIRKEDEHCILTIKAPVADRQQQSSNPPVICNREEEFEITESQYAHLKEKSDGLPVSKTRYRIPLPATAGDAPGNLRVAELDIFHGRHEGLRMVEVEFLTEEEALRFKPPAWFGQEVTADPHFRNSWLALHP